MRRFVGCELQMANFKFSIPRYTRDKFYNPQSAIPAWEQNGLNHIWLPYTQMQTAPTPPPVVSARGVRLTLADGRELIDGLASWWCACHGYQHPYMIERMTEQLNRLSHVMFAGLANEPAYTLAARLASIAPTGLTRVFFSDSGSVAVEVALKMAVQFWWNQGNLEKRRFISFQNGYHGDTMGCMSLSDPEHSMHWSYHHYTPRQYVLPIPRDASGLADFENAASRLKTSVAGVVIEPLVQCAGGMKFHSPEILAEIYRICKKHELLFIADEIATGFGRTGAMFACDEAGIAPDIMCLGKALTGGTMGLAATLTTGAVYDAFLSDGLESALMHGPTFMGNPLACASANASLDLFEREPRLEQVQAIEAQLKEELQPCRRLKQVVDVRVKGAIGVVQLSQPGQEYIMALRRQFVAEGVWLRPFGDVVYIMPAFTISSEELTKLTRAVFNVLAK
jgi:adenosylmethionine-8-amino-7-oxononanoate aminotransferase